MKYFFVLGKNPTLSMAELAAVFGLNNELKNELFAENFLFEDIFILETKEKIDAKSIIKRLGGIRKIGEITAEANDGIENILQKIKPLLMPQAGKYKFGISYYGKTKFNIKTLGMEIKKHVRKLGFNARWVTSREPTLSSVVVEQNKLIPSVSSGQADKGVEIVLIPSPRQGKKRNDVLIGRTLAVQPFKELSFRDYGRPARDDYSGMLPPKLAQIMINLSATPLIKGGGEIILDPFCGSGTILTEAMLMGYENLIGADISQKALEDTGKNIEWTSKNFKSKIPNLKLLRASASSLSKYVKPYSVDAIVTEPYLGPQRGKIDIKKVKTELEELYSRTLAEFFKILKNDGRVVMIWPVFLKAPLIKGVGGILNPGLNGFKIVNPIPKSLRKNKIIKLTERNSIIYGRPDQKVWREIIVLRK